MTAADWKPSTTGWHMLRNDRQFYSLPWLTGGTGGRS